MVTKVVNRPAHFRFPLFVGIAKCERQITYFDNIDLLYFLGWEGTVEMDSKSYC